ncbi:unannotated protein [freshwater metagenome]|uniref:Unannotated protein n=1 Tax=freshwater metagenome TaxID=449393 RepID=A0A6J6UVD5_9ZZZZ
MILQFDKEIVFTKDFLQSSRTLLRTGGITLHQALQNVPTQAAACCDETLAVPCEQFPVHSRLVVVTLQKCKAG